MLRAKSVPGTLLATLAVACFLIGATPAASQDRSDAPDIVELYRARRMNSRATIQSFFRMRGHPPVALAEPCYHCPVRAEDPTTRDAAPAVRVYDARRIPKFAQRWFEERYSDVEWAYDGGNTLAPLDTMFTREIRARMEHEFGAPTRTLGDRGPLHAISLPEYVQFEYWFVVNGEWPVIIMDVNGPFERGVVVAAEARHRGYLREIRDSILAPVLATRERAPYADYFFETELNEWYLTGFDGRSYFLRPVNPRSVNPGRPVPPEPGD